MKGFTEQQQADFVELAQEIGLTPAMKSLGYPKSWATASKWCKARNVEVTIDTLRQHAKEFDLYYGDRDKLLVLQESLRRIYQLMISDDALNADDIKKLSDAAKRLIEAMQLVEGKATNINQTNNDDSVFKNLLDEFNKSKEAIDS